MNCEHCYRDNADHEPKDCPILAIPADDDIDAMEAYVS